MSVNYHALNDFRAGNEALMDELLTDNVAALAAVGAASFRRQAARGPGARRAHPSRAGATARSRRGAKAEDARSSTTAADARVMKMGDGGFRPAFNVQLATECEGQVIVGMDVVNAGSDMAQLAPMVEQRLGRSPGEWLVDGGLPAHQQIDAVAEPRSMHRCPNQERRRTPGRTSRATRCGRTSMHPSLMTRRP